jgi:hypothetical protein
MDRRLALFVLLATGCAPTALDDAIAETGVEGPFDSVPGDDEGKYDGTAARGPSVAAGVATEVWAVRNAWADTDAADARAAGMAWPADSGLDWEQKFDAWIASFQTEARHGGSGQTFVMTTPYGERRFHAPTLECAEVALMLRASFASWYHLPFFVQGWDARTRQAMYAGHFGFVNRSGQRVGNFPQFRTAYADHEVRWEEGDAWPSDSRLRGFRLGTDDAIEFLSTDAQEVGAGAYFDEVFLNKRVGYFMRLLLLYFGSANLADGANLFHVQPEHVAPGDVLLHRWQRRGIGHVMPIFRVTRYAEDALEVTVASGSMPRREPVWEEPNTARGRFTNPYAGGPGQAADGNAYAALGGGVRRWRTPRLSSGRWRNEVAVRDRDAFIADSDHEAVAARPARFEQILRALSVIERRDVALAQIEAAREHLRNYPASCAARVRREDAFEQLYAVLAEQGMDRAAVDGSYRQLEDYAFAALVYAESRTCCWNSTTRAMSEIALSFAEAEQAEAEAEGMCVAPTVFRAHTDGYERWRAYAVSIGRGGEWRAWREDETCAQRDVPEDAEDAARAATGWCDLSSESSVPSDPTDAGCDATGGSSQASAAPLAIGASLSARLCTDESDWYRVDAPSGATVTITFDHAAGDLDMEALSADGVGLSSSTSVQSTETVQATGPFFVRVYGYRGAANAYSIQVL